MKRELYQHIASRLKAMENCLNTGNTEWLDKHEHVIEQLIKKYMPSGSGFDNGTKLNYAKSSADRLEFTSFHHMNDVGYYDGWTEHTVVITPSLAFGFNMRVTGHDRRQIKDLIAEVFDSALTEQIGNDDAALLVMA